MGPRDFCIDITENGDPVGESWFMSANFPLSNIFNSLRYAPLSTPHLLSPVEPNEFVLWAQTMPQNFN